MSFEYHCPKCGAGISRGQVFCHSCDAILEWDGERVRVKSTACPKCGASVSLGANWCPKCGYEIHGNGRTATTASGGGGLGDTIQSAGTVICVILVIVSLIGGIVILSTSKYLTAVGLIVMAVGCLLAWLTTLLMRGFGQLISDTAMIRALLSRQEKK